MGSAAENDIIIKRSFTETIADYYQLTKPGITLTVVISMLAGYVIGSGADFSYIMMLNVLVGSFLIASGTAAHNQFMERDYDGLMNRTKNRPLPAHKLTPKQGGVFSFTLMFAGLFYLLIFVNPVAGSVAFATTFIYLAIYTPMKRISAVNVAIGAVPGALPPVGGWAAATGNITEPGMWILFGIVYFWQATHVLAIAWYCKDDYAGAGYRMVPKNDASGKKTAFYCVLGAFLLFPVTYGLYFLGLTGLVYLFIAMPAALFFFYYSVIFAKERTRENAKKLMFASFAYLPLYWIAVFVDLALF